MNRLAALAYDRFLMGASQEAGLRELRARALAPARGETLEIGAGTGLNLVEYPREGVTRLVCTEPSHAMARPIGAKAGPAPAVPEVVEAPAAKLPFPDDSFDTVVGTLVFCEVPDQSAALEEIARVLRPGGSFCFLEHVRSDDPELARRQDEARVRLERMLLDPAGNRGVRISQRELGEPGCGVWRVAPRVGIIGRMMGWWQVKLSSGCPLAT